MYGKIINGELVFAPVNYKTSDGVLITNFNTNEDLMIKYGFKKINGIKPEYDEDKECIIVKSFEELTDEIKVDYEVKGIGALLENTDMSKDELIETMRKELCSYKEGLVEGTKFDNLNSVFKYMFEHFTEEEIYIGKDIPSDPKYKLWIRIYEEPKDDDDDGKDVPSNPTPVKPPAEDKTVWVSNLTLDSTIMGYYIDSEFTSDKYPDKNICLTTDQRYVGQYVKFADTGKDIDGKVFQITGTISNDALGLSSSHSLPVFAVNCKDQPTATAIGENTGKAYVGLLLSSTTKVAKVICNALNVRSGMGVKYPVLGAIPNGYTLPILETYTNTSWVKVSYNNSIGYINANSSYVTISTITVDAGGTGEVGGNTGFTVPCMGVDISKYQGNLDFAKIKTYGETNFAILRIGYGSRKGGQPIIDPKFEEYLKGCVENKIPVGVYFFSYANTVEKVKVEANWVVQQLNKYSQTFEFPIFFDQENDLVNKLGNPGKTVLTNCMNAFCQIINDAGYMAGIYTNNSWATSYVNWSNVKYTDHIWVAQWSSACTWTRTDVKLWQGGYKKLSGYGGVDVDFDTCYFDYPTYVRANHKNGF
jgi:GH25 family lysozyme M1 (1,4-beta-N-acetylmuramidase)